jgi:hypothetical protein
VCVCVCVLSLPPINIYRGIGLHVIFSLFLSFFSQNSRYILLKLPNIKFHEKAPNGSRSVSSVQMNLQAEGADFIGAPQDFKCT